MICFNYLVFCYFVSVPFLSGCYKWARALPAPPGTFIHAYIPIDVGIFGIPTDFSWAMLINLASLAMHQGLLGDLNTKFNKQVVLNLFICAGIPF